MTTDITKTNLLDYPAVFAALPDLYLLLDTHFNIREVSDSYLKATLSKREVLLGKNIFDVFPENPAEIRPTGVTNLRNSLERVLSTRKADAMAVQKYDISSGLGDGKFEERYWSHVNLPVLDGKNEIQYILHRVVDVTEFVHLKQEERIQDQLKTPLQKMEREIYQRAQEIQEENHQLRIINDRLVKKEMDHKKLFDKLQRINQIKTQFLSSISHELRTPLTLILAAVKKLNTDAKFNESRYDVNLIERNAYELLRHINDLMDISKLETKKIELFYSNCDLVRIVRHTAALFESHSRTKQINYKVESPVEILAVLDVQKIQRILVNLFNNAFRYTPIGGSIECKVRVDEKSATIEISDSGPGVPLEMRETLFNNYFYGRGQDQKKVSSLGLGLTIVKDFIELHGGIIRIDSSNLGGALFVINLPLKAPNSAKIEMKGSDPKTFPKELLPELFGEFSIPLELDTFSTKTVDPSKAHLPTVLIVEDNYDMSQYISTILESDYQIMTAFNGTEGLEKALQTSPDLILGDLLMPKMDGSEMVREMRRHKELMSIPIIILTASMDDEVCSKLLTEGAQDYLIKPFSQLELRARVANLIELKKASDELRRKNVELIETNNELDAFGYSVSHDLRNPVQSIIGFCTLLLDAFNLDDEVRDYIKNMHYSGKRMEELINDLLVLSHSLREDVNYQDVNLSEVVTNILNKLQKKDAPRIVQTLVYKDLHALVDGRLIEIALENLLNNAWKYSSKNPKASIEFGVIEDGEIPTYFIKDNGVGFEQEKAGKLFAPFTRLHEEKDFPGTGVGLATVKRIIEKHDGKIWVESKPGVGTIFYFQLLNQSE